MLDAEIVHDAVTEGIEVAVSDKVAGTEGMLAKRKVLAEESSEPPTRLLDEI